MTIAQLLHAHELPFEIRNVEITGICSDSRHIRPGELFFVIEGKTHDVFSYLDAIASIPAAFVVSRMHRSKVTPLLRRRPVIYVDDINSEFRRCIDSVYPLKTDGISYIGVTGTNGKTTVTHLIWSALQHLGKNAVLLGTVAYRVGNEVLSAPNTTPDYLALRKLLWRAHEAGAQYIVMEVSSHGIVQGRIAGIPFNVCIFTNLSRDHLDYHLDMEDYFSVKKSFITANSSCFRLINIDNPYGKRIWEELNDNGISYGFAPRSSYRVIGVKLCRQGSDFTLEKKGGKTKVQLTTPLLGRYNVANVTAAVACLEVLGFPLPVTAPFFRSEGSVPGRLERAGENIFVDYAHTPDALENVLGALKESGYNTIIAVFGCGGNRDKGKRAMMGDIASRLADFSFVTTDNPRDEDPSDICSDIARGFQKDNFEVIIDRKEAIRAAIFRQGQKPDTAVLIAGKGHETYQVTKKTKSTFSDSAAVREIIANGRI